MPARTKRVNVTTVVAVRTTNPPICGTLKNIEMSTGDILKCLCKRAKVEEILSDGSVILLNMKNYYTDNEPVVAAAAPTSVKPEPKIEDNNVEAVVVKGGDTDESVQEEPVIHAIADVAAETTEDPVVETVQEDAAEVSEGNEAVSEHEEPAAEVAGGDAEEAVEEVITTEDDYAVAGTDDIDATSAHADPVAATETTLGSPVDPVENASESTTANNAPKNNTPKKKKK